MLEHLEHQSLGAAGLAPIAKPARNKALRDAGMRIQEEKYVFH
jgi:hypothetical protein